MAESPLAIRGTAEQKEKFKEIAEGYTNQSEAFEALLKAYTESQAFADKEAKIHLDHVRSLCNNVYGAFETLLIGQGAELDKVKAEGQAELKELKDKLSQKEKELSDALDQEKKAELELERVKSEENTLKELNEALKGKNEALTEQVDLLKEKITELEKNKRTAARKKAEEKND